MEKKLEQAILALKKRYPGLKMVPRKVFFKAIRDAGVTTKDLWALQALAKKTGWWLGENGSEISIQKRIGEQETPMLKHLMNEMREEAGLTEARYSAQYGRTPKGDWGLAEPAVRMAQGEYDSLQDYIGRIKKVSKEIARVWPEGGVSGAYIGQMEKAREPVLENLRQANKYALEAVKALVRFKAWAEANAEGNRKYVGR